MYIHLCITVFLFIYKDDCCLMPSEGFQLYHGKNKFTETT